MKNPITSFKTALQLAKAAFGTAVSALLALTTALDANTATFAALAIELSALKRDVAFLAASERLDRLSRGHQLPQEGR